MIVTPKAPKHKLAQEDQEIHKAVNVFPPIPELNAIVAMQMLMTMLMVSAKPAHVIHLDLQVPPALAQMDNVHVLPDMREPNVAIVV